MSDAELSRFAQEMANTGAGDKAQPTSVPGDRTRSGEAFDILRVDYGWVDRMEDKRELRLAYEALTLDAGFPDLTAYCLKKLKTVDKRYKT